VYVIGGEVSKEGGPSSAARQPPMADARNATAWLPLPSVFRPAMRAAATRLSPTGWHGCRFPLVRWH